MKLTPIVAGAAAGAVLVAGGLAAVELGTDSAQAHGGGETQTTLDSKIDAANLRSQAAIRLSKDLQNNVGKYFQPKGQLIGAKPPPPAITQERGTGDGGLPGSAIKNGAITASKVKDGVITESKLAAALADKLPRSIAKVDNLANTTSRASSTDYSVLRLGVGNYRADFGDKDISRCAITAVPFVDVGLPVAIGVPTALDVTDPTRLVVRPTGSDGAAVDSGWQVVIFC